MSQATGTWRAWGVALALACGCTRPGSTLLHLDAIDAADRPRPCLFVINGDFVDAAARQQWVNIEADDTLQLEIPLDDEGVEVTAVPLRVVDGKVANLPRTPKEAEVGTGFAAETRRITRTDPMRHLFILARARAK